MTIFCGGDDFCEDSYEFHLIRKFQKEKKMYYCAMLSILIFIVATQKLYKWFAVNNDTNIILISYNCIPEKIDRF